MPRFPLLARAAVVACLLLGVASHPAHAVDPVIAAAGDIACDPDHADFNNGDGTATLCRQKYTSDQLVGAGLAGVLVLGDAQYAEGTLDQFMGSYDPTWGRMKSITRPAIGNHEYRLNSGGAGYWDYFNGVGNANGIAGQRGKGYYSFDIGKWHLIALNSMCTEVGGCHAGSVQEQWLRADLAANADASCTLAFWHHPLFNSGPEGSYADTIWNTTPLWQALYDAGADLVLNGHSHRYERFAPQDPLGNADPQHGLREFIIGTGGRSLTEFATTQPNSEFRDFSQYGVVKFVLRPNGYDWTFVNDAGVAGDSGKAACHGAPSGTTPPDTTAPDTTAPDTSISSGPTGTIDTTSATFSFAASEAGSTYQCRLDSGTWASCSSPATYNGLAEGGHTFEARAIDAAGNTDPTPAARTFTVATSPSSPGSPDTDPADTPGSEPPTDSRDPVDSFSLERYRPSGYEITAGRVHRGRGERRRLYRDDDSRLDIAAAQKRSGAYLAAFHVLIPLVPEPRESLQSLVLGYDGGASARGAAVTLHVFNFRTRRWVKLFTGKGRRDRNFEWSASAFALDYISSQDTVRVRVTGEAAAPFRTRTDLVGAAITY